MTLCMRCNDETCIRHVQVCYAFSQLAAGFVTTRDGTSPLSPYFKDIDRALVDEAHALGLRVVVWTVNQSEDIEKMLDLLIDGIISDRPDLVRTAMTARKMPLPQPTPITP